MIKYQQNQTIKKKKDVRKHISDVFEFIFIILFHITIVGLSVWGILRIYNSHLTQVTQVYRDSLLVTYITLITLVICHTGLRLRKFY